LPRKGPGNAHQYARQMGALIASPVPIGTARRREASSRAMALSGLSVFVYCAEGAPKQPTHRMPWSESNHPSPSSELEGRKPPSSDGSSVSVLRSVFKPLLELRFLKARLQLRRCTIALVDTRLGLSESSPWVWNGAQWVRSAAVSGGSIPMPTTQQLTHGSEALSSYSLLAKAMGTRPMSAGLPRSESTIQRQSAGLPSTR